MKLNLIPKNLSEIPYPCLILSKLGIWFHAEDWGETTRPAKDKNGKLTYVPCEIFGNRYGEDLEVEESIGWVPLPSKQKFYSINLYDYADDIDYYLEYVGPSSSAPTPEEFRNLIAKKCKELLKKENRWVVENLFHKDWGDNRESPLYRLYEAIFISDDFNEESGKIEATKFFNEQGAKLKGTISDFAWLLLSEPYTDKNQNLISFVIENLPSSDWKQGIKFEGNLRFSLCSEDRSVPCDPENWTAWGAIVEERINNETL